MNAVNEEKIIHLLADISKLIVAQSNYFIGTEEVHYKQMDMILTGIEKLVSLQEANNEILKKIAKASGVEIELTI